MMCVVLWFVGICCLVLFGVRHLLGRVVCFFCCCWRCVVFSVWWFVVFDVRCLMLVACHVHACCLLLALCCLSFVVGCRLLYSFRLFGIRRGVLDST